MNTNLVMRIHFRIIWSKTTLYNAGQREFTIEWNNSYGFPKKGDGICIPEFIEKDYSAEELFYYNGEEHTVFDWIQAVSRWEVSKVVWNIEDGVPCMHIFVEDV